MIIGGASIVDIRYGNNYDWYSFPAEYFCDNRCMFVCFRDQEPVGFLMASLTMHFFDPSLKVLKQNLLFSLPNTRASYWLMKEFIDFGKVHANHIITCIGSETNISRRSLEKLGFKKLEEVFRMET